MICKFHRKILHCALVVALGMTMKFFGTCARPSNLSSLVKKPPIPIYFDVVEGINRIDDVNSRTRFTFPSTNLKQILLATSTSPPLTTPYPFLMSPEDVMMVTINDMTHVAFAHPTKAQTFHKISSLRNLQKPIMPYPTQRPRDGFTSSSQSKPFISPPLKIGGHISYNFIPSPKPVSQLAQSTKYPFSHYGSNPFNLETSETENRGSRIHNLVTAEELGGNRPTLTPFHFRTPLPTPTAPPTTSTTTRTTTTIPPQPPTELSITVLQSSIPRSRINRYREGKKVQSPHNYSFAPTQNPIAFTHSETDIAKEDLNEFRSALKKFGSRRPTTATAEAQTTTTTKTTTQKPTSTQAYEPETPPTVTEITTTPAHAVKIRQGKIVSQPGPIYQDEDVKGQDEGTEELPFFRESGGIFEQIPQAEKESRVYPGNYRGQREYEQRTVDYSTQLPRPGQHTAHAHYTRQPTYEDYPAVTYRPSNHDPRNYELRNHNYDHGKLAHAHLTQGQIQKHRFQNPPKPTVEFHHYTPPAHYRDTAQYDGQQIAHQPPSTTRFSSPPYDNDAYSLLPFPSPTTDRSIHFAKKPPPKFDPASDYFYGDPRPPPPAPSTKAPMVEDEPPDKEEEEEEEDEEEENAEEEEKEEDSRDKVEGHEKHENEENGDENEEHEPPHREQPIRSDDAQNQNRDHGQNGNEPHKFYHQTIGDRPSPTLEQYRSGPQHNDRHAPGHNDRHAPGYNYRPHQNEFMPPNRHPEYGRELVPNFRPQPNGYRPTDEQPFTPAHRPIHRQQPFDNKPQSYPKPNVHTQTFRNPQSVNNGIVKYPRDRPFRPSDIDPIQQPFIRPAQNVFEFDDHRDQPDYNGERERKRVQPGAYYPQASPTGSLDPIYTMSIKDYDAEIKRRQKPGSSPQRPQTTRPKFPQNSNQFNSRPVVSNREGGRKSPRFEHAQNDNNENFYPHHQSNHDEDSNTFPNDKESNHDFIDFEKDFENL